MSYECRTELSGITVPDWLKKAAGAVFRGTTVSVPTPVGPPIVIDLGNPASVAAAKSAITGAKFTTSVGNNPPTPAQQVTAAVDSAVPGGFVTIAAAGLAVLMLMRGKR